MMLKKKNYEKKLFSEDLPVTSLKQRIANLQSEDLQKKNESYRKLAQFQKKNGVNPIFKKNKPISSEDSLHKGLSHEELWQMFNYNPPKKVCLQEQLLTMIREQFELC